MLGELFVDLQTVPLSMQKSLTPLAAFLTVIAEKPQILPKVPAPSLIGGSICLNQYLLGSISVDE